MTQDLDGEERIRLVWINNHPLWDLNGFTCVPRSMMPDSSLGFKFLIATRPVSLSPHLPLVWVMIRVRQVQADQSLSSCISSCNQPCLLVLSMSHPHTPGPALIGVVLRRRTNGFHCVSLYCIMPDVGQFNVTPEQFEKHPRLTSYLAANFRTSLSAAASVRLIAVIQFQCLKNFFFWILSTWFV